MRRVLGRWLPVAAATITGLLVLGGYFFPRVPFLVGAHSVMLDWAIVVSAFAVLLGVVNIVRVHGRRIADAERGWPYSLVLLLAALASWIPGILPIDDLKILSYEYVLRPLGASLGGLMAITLVVAAVRMLRARQSVEVPVFLVVVGVVLLGSTPLAGSGILAGFRDWLIRFPGMAGARGLLLGVALGTVITGLRVILTSERPYAEPRSDRGSGGQAPSIAGLGTGRDE